MLTAFHYYQIVKIFNNWNNKNYKHDLNLFKSELMYQHSYSSKCRHILSDFEG